jgi:hypothetical protein
MVAQSLRQLLGGLAVIIAVSATLLVAGAGLGIALAYAVS